MFKKTENVQYEMYICSGISGSGKSFLAKQLKENKIIKINGKNRALVDIMRSLAHELVHHKQYEEGRLKVKPPDIGGEIEDEANAKAGQFIKMYALNNQNIYDE